MTLVKERLTEAIEAKKNDLSSFVWKYARKSDGTQEEIKLMEATPEQLQQFYDHCNSMLYQKDKINPGRKILLNIIKNQRDKCNTEIFLRKLEKGSISADGKPYPRYLFLQDLSAFLASNQIQFPKDKYKETSIAYCINGLPREFERLNIDIVRDALLDQIGYFDNKHITFSFIIKMGVYLTPEEMREFSQTDENGNRRSRLEIIKERLNINPDVHIVVKPSGLSFTELRAMLGLRYKKYSELTTDQLLTLRNKVLFRLEQEVEFHISQWEDLKSKLEKVAEAREIELVNHVE